jgi:dienelactone hydrolase
MPSHRIPLVPYTWTRSRRGVSAATVVVICVLGGLRAAPSAAEERRPTDKPTPAGALAADLGPLWRCVSGERESFSIAGTVSVRRGDRPIEVSVRLERFDADSFDLSVEHPEYAAILRRRVAATALALPKHRVVHLGRGDADPEDHLDPEGVAGRIAAEGTQLSVVRPLLAQATPATLAGLATGLLGLERDPVDGRWKRGDRWLSLDDGGRRIRAAVGDVAIELRIGDAGACPDVDDFPGCEPHAVPRDEIERTLCRGARRALEILLPGPDLVAPERRPLTVANGSLEWVDGLRVVTLHGSPEEIGRAHGELLAAEAHRCVDSVLHVVGTVETIRGGVWFRERLADAARRLAPHIPPHHAAETRAMATALALDPELVAQVNVFPELFHCSGFAVAGSATSDGTLYHGRVLDYMTEIGLQDSAAAFVIAPRGRIPFVTVGYAGFTGSVTGMNARRISLGEMGGRGEGLWDGVPMATLMRRALEECSTLDEVVDLWKRSPRTCEYYYVFADGNSRRSVGVAATPERLELVGPGEAHERLGPGIPDAVLLSAGDRLACLRQRVSDLHGRIDEQAALRLMDRPVAMRSNLHNVLFVPERLVLHVAHASRGKPAAECPAIRLDLGALLRAIPGGAAGPGPDAAPPPAAGTALRAVDSLVGADDDRRDASECLAGLRWEPRAFDVTVEDAKEGNGDLRLRFPSPRDDGPDCNDTVWMEWYQARDADGDVVRGPACVVVHESGSGMNVGRLVARGLSLHGVHAFMVQLPFYGARRPREGRAGAEALVPAVRQAVADVRRARDAAAAVPLVDAERISLQGTSLGGFVAATAAGLDAGFDKVFIFLAGGDLVGVLEKGRRDAEKVRAKLAASGMTEEQVRETLRGIEPTRLAHRYRADRTWLYSGKYDDVVPPDHSRLLAEAAGLSDDHHVRMEANHYTGIVYLPMILANVAREIRGGDTAARETAIAP